VRHVLRINVLVPVLLVIETRVAVAITVVAVVVVAEDARAVLDLVEKIAPRLLLRR
jgi:hypothetical protein